MSIEPRILPELREVYSQFPGFELEKNLEWSRSLVSAASVEGSEHVNTTVAKSRGMEARCW